MGIMIYFAMQARLDAITATALQRVMVTRGGLNAAKTPARFEFRYGVELVGHPRFVTNPALPVRFKTRHRPVQ